ncbi:hypothetical protein LPJ66_010892, partial [Kickxella alabastrina]
RFVMMRRRREWFRSRSSSRRPSVTGITRRHGSRPATAASMRRRALRSPLLATAT